MDMCKGGREPKYVSHIYRIEYMEAGQIKVDISGYRDVEAVKEMYRSLWRNCKILSICLLNDYKALYEKYSDIMNPVEYKR